MSAIAILMVTALVSGATDAFVTVTPVVTAEEGFELGGQTLQDLFVPTQIEEIYQLRGRTR